MTTQCSYCNQRGHNIRTCTDPDIKRLWKDLMVEFVIPAIDSTLTERDEWAIIGFLASKYDDSVLRAAAIQYCGTNHGSASYIMCHYRNEFVSRVYRELAYVNLLDEHGRTQWISLLDVEDSVDIDDPDTVTFIEDRVGSFKPILTEYPVIDSMIICLETGTEIADLRECVICHDDKMTIAFDTTNCGHHFCHGCIVQHIESKEMKSAACPLCRQPISSLEVKDVENLEDLHNRFSSTAFILKDCSQMAFGSLDFVKDKTIEQSIDEFRNHFISNTELVAEINSATTDFEKAEHIWRFVILIQEMDIPQPNNSSYLGDESYLDLSLLDSFTF